MRKIQRILKAEAGDAEEEDSSDEEAPSASARQTQVASTQQTMVEDLGEPTASDEEV